MPRLSLLILAAAVATPAFAQTTYTAPAGTAPAAATDNPNMRDETRADAEGRAATMFARMDINHDGVVTLDEIGAFMTARSSARTSGALPPVPPMAKAMFDDADADHDGRISAEESKAAADRGFDDADTDHDGVVTPAERMAVTQDVLKAPARPKAPASASAKPKPKAH